MSIITIIYFTCQFITHRASLKLVHLSELYGVNDNNVTSPKCSLTRVHRHMISLGMYNAMSSRITGHETVQFVPFRMFTSAQTGGNCPTWLTPLTPNHTPPLRKYVYGTLMLTLSVFGGNVDVLIILFNLRQSLLLSEYGAIISCWRGTCVIIDWHVL